MSYCSNCATLSTALTAARQAQGVTEQERDEWRVQSKLLEHKVITCGVAATHPNANLTREKKCYAETWNSPQAEAVRELRARAEASARALSDLQQQIRELVKYTQHKPECRSLMTNDDWNRTNPPGSIEVWNGQYVLKTKRCTCGLSAIDRSGGGRTREGQAEEKSEVP